MFGLFESVQYRIRIFDHGLIVGTKMEPAKGQRFFKKVVHKEKFGFGEKTTLAFMRNPKIEPKIFGKILELDFDIKDSAPLADFLDVCPEFVFEINNKYREVYNQKKGIEDASFTTIDETLLEPKGALNLEEDEDKRGIDQIVDAAKAAALIIPNLPVLNKHFGAKGEKIEQCLALVQKHPKTLYWLPELLDIEPEITEIVSQCAVYQHGVESSFYKATVDAPIAEKMMTRPKDLTSLDWKVILIIGIVCCVIFLGFVYLLTR